MTSLSNFFDRYIRVLLAALLHFVVRVIVLAPLACLMFFSSNSKLWLGALLCPVLLIFVVLPLRFSFAEAMVHSQNNGKFSIAESFRLSDYGEKLTQSIFHALHVLKWGIPFFALVGYGLYMFIEADALTALNILTEIGGYWARFTTSIVNFFGGIFGKEPKAIPMNTLMDGLTAVLFAVGLCIAVWLYGAMRNSAFRYIWVLANEEDQSPRREMRLRLVGRRFRQTIIGLINLILWTPLLVLVVTSIKPLIGNLSSQLLSILLTGGSIEFGDLVKQLVPTALIAFSFYIILLPVRRLFTSSFATQVCPWLSEKRNKYNG